MSTSSTRHSPSSENTPATQNLPQDNHPDQPHPDQLDLLELLERTAE